MAWFDALELSKNAILLTVTVLIGLVGATGVILFNRAIDRAFHDRLQMDRDGLGPGVRAIYRPPSPRWGWWLRGLSCRMQST